MIQKNVSINFVSREILYFQESQKVQVVPQKIKTQLVSFFKLGQILVTTHCRKIILRKVFKTLAYIATFHFHSLLACYLKHQ